jgi:hypothetical protein
MLQLFSLRCETVDQEIPAMFIIQQGLFPTQVLNFLVFNMLSVTWEILLRVDRPLGISPLTHDSRTILDDK